MSDSEFSNEGDEEYEEKDPDLERRIQDGDEIILSSEDGEDGNRDEIESNDEEIENENEEDDDPAFGTVFLVRKNRGVDKNKIYAIKVIAKDEVVKVPKTIVHMKAEREVLEKIRGSPFMPNLYYAFQTEEKLFLVIDYIPGGEMFTLLQRQPIRESNVRFYIAELVLALEQLHMSHIVYRDIKLENILIDAAGHVKLVDFGLCKKLGLRQRTKSFCGTVEYMAPEIIKGDGHNSAADWWAIGVLTCELLSTVTPFGSSEPPESNGIMDNILYNDPIIPTDISEEMRDFIEQMLQKEPEKRLGGSQCDAKEIKNHRLFRGIDWEKLKKKQIPSPEAPLVTDVLDTRNFAEEFTQKPAIYEPSEVPPRTFLTFKDYSYIAPGLEPVTPEYGFNHSIDESWNPLSWEIYCSRELNSEFDRKYKFLSTRPMGKGKRSVCMKCLGLLDNKEYAVKIYRRGNDYHNQIDVLQKAATLKVTGVLNLVEVLHDTKWTYLVMDLIKGVNLIDYLNKNISKAKLLQKTCTALFNIVNDVHSLNYVHKRICFKNIYVVDEQTPEFRLIGFSNTTPIIDPNDCGVDHWSIGIILYTVFCGRAPFDMATGDLPAITRRIENSDFEQEFDKWETLNKPAKRLIEQLLSNSATSKTSIDFKCVNDYSERVDRKQFIENEKIVTIRALTERRYPVNELNLPFNGFTNGNNLIESPSARLTRSSKSNDENHSNHVESRNNLYSNVNGHVGKGAKKRTKNMKADIVEIKKNKIVNSEKIPMPMVAELLQDHEIKTEMPTTTRSLRSRAAVPSTKTSVTSETRSGQIQIKKREIAVTELS